MGFFDAPVSGMDTFQQYMNVIGNNISNSNTVGYKTSEANFADMLSQTVKSGSGGTTTGIGGTNPQQVGLGVKMAAINPIFTQGALTQTGTPSDLAIDGSGFFTVSASNTGSNPVYTRAGNFQIDNSGNLVTANGDYVLGYNETAPGGATYTSGPAVPINIMIGTPAAPAQYTIGNDGTVTVTDGTTTKYFQIPIANFANPSGMTKIGDNLYASGGNSGAVTYGQPGSGNYGSIQQGFLESSNVDLTRELSNMLIAQTGYGANSKVINTQNQMFQQLIQNV